MFWEIVYFGTLSIFGYIIISEGFKNWDIVKFEKQVLVFMYWSTSNLFFWDIFYQKMHEN